MGLRFLIEYLRAAATEAPIVLLAEDLHWADESSLDVLSGLERLTGALPMLVVGAARPILFEQRPLWAEGRENHTRIVLSPLSRQDSRRLVQEILQLVAEVPAELRELIVRNGEGNPFYVEELIKMLIEEGVIVKGEDAWRVAEGRLAEVRVPATLTGVLQARLDSLPEAERAALQRAAVVGRIFWGDAVAYLRGWSRRCGQGQGWHRE